MAGEGWKRSPVTPSQIFSANRYRSFRARVPQHHICTSALHAQPLGFPAVGQEGKAISPLIQEINGMRSLHTIPAVKKCIFYQVSGTTRVNATSLCTKERISGLSLRYLKQTHTVAPTADTRSDLFPLLATCERWPVWKQVVNTLLHLSEWPCKNPSWLFCRKRKIWKELKKET